ncbi:MAG: hypothetical protein ACRYFS_02245 [Janthinobacterium lividum]
MIDHNVVPRELRDCSGELLDYPVTGLSLQTDKYVCVKWQHGKKQLKAQRQMIAARAETTNENEKNKIMRRMN